MDINVAQGGGDVFLFGIPLIALLIFGFFRLDEVFTSSKKGPPPGVPEPSKPTRQRPKLMHSDPDGRPWD
jgi:hypothetical protein